MHEIIVNLHMHTFYSDGHVTHAQIARAALQAGLDAVIVTDHNVWVNGPAGYYPDGRRRVLMLVGEEIHNQARHPQKNHLLVLGANRELATLAHDLPRLIEGVREAGGLAFLAHPSDPPAPAFGETDISWVDWEVQGYTGLELWNAMSEFKSRLRSRLHALYYVLDPRRIARGPFESVLRQWDELLAHGRRLVAIGGSDAHALPARMGPLRRTLFPYEFHFRTINTHLLLPRPLSGDYNADARLVIDALRQGHAFIGYDLPAPTRGFRFTASGLNGIAWMGDEILARHGVTLQIRLPARAECHLLKDGKVLKTWHGREALTHSTAEPGVYRVEVYLRYLGKRRGWIFSNPIYVKRK
jgi:hypothetical protein